ncbi:MAG TPA: type II toxin-antitoxin system prevent-host-death family antitoxin [Actinomycetota bacterium]|nr:type II toxin-antitoxin system prevent-host-death family antitoxin [Actinomycetota bacterium]
MRELRQNLSVYLRKVVKGATLEVTEHGHPVALLMPIPLSNGPIAQLVGTGRARAAEGSLLDLLPPKGRASRRLTRALEDERADRL